MPRTFPRSFRIAGGAAAALALPSLVALAAASGQKPVVKSAAKTSAAPTRAQLQARFDSDVKPFLNTYCTPCHGAKSPQAQLNLSAFATIESVTRDYPHWALVKDRIDAGDMPPASFGKKVGAAQRDSVMAWIRDVRRYEAAKNAGDPGPVLARRLSNAEYDYTIRDLTGVDLRPTREFPVDPANQEGFDNSGESLTLSPSLIKKYAQAAKTIADHLALTTTGLEFASHPVLVDTDRDKFCILRIVDFYKKQPTDFADYFEAAWALKHRAALGKPDATPDSIAAERKLSARYLRTLADSLADSSVMVGPMATARKRFDELPAPQNGAAPQTLRADCESLRNWTLDTRKKIAWKFDNLRAPDGFSSAGQAFVLWKCRQYASHRRSFWPAKLQLDGVPNTITVRGKRKEGGEREPDQKVPEPVDADLFAPKDEAARAPFVKSFETFASVFPDAFYIAERGRMFLDDPNDKGRLLTAGLHNAVGYFRDDTPLMEMFLDDAGRRKLDAMWRDFDAIASVPERMHLEFFFAERAEYQTILDPEFDFARAENRDNLLDPNIKKMCDLYRAKAVRRNAGPGALVAIDEYFQNVHLNIRAAEKARTESEKTHLRDLLTFAARAYRRPLTAAEKSGLLGFYRGLRDLDGLTHDEAVRDCVTRVLMSPNFLFRLDLEADAESSESGESSDSLTAVAQRAAKPAPPESNGGIEPLSDFALANRLSYFLWASLPDDELMAVAAKGELRKPEVLVAQARRMMKSPKIRALALEFGGNWLEFRRFEAHNAVDRNRFPSFTDGLRQSMFEEPIHFFVDGFQNNGALTDLLFGSHTFVNATLAKHYGMDDVPVSGDNWVRVNDARKYGRGGLLPMGVFLTANSPGLRTSPVKRGYWVVRRVLGEHIPPPPAAVPELPKDESALGDLTLRQALAKHRDNAACAGCHTRFDSYGLVFEGYGPIGERRTKDLGGKPVDNHAPFPGGADRSDVSGLREFIGQKRQGDFLETITRKMLSYGLGRTLLPSDDPAIESLQKRLAASGYHYNTLIESIVTSRQFRYRRAAVAPKPTAQATEE